MIREPIPFGEPAEQAASGRVLEALRGSRWLVGSGGVVAFLLAWEVSVRSFEVNVLLVPPPSAIARALAAWAGEGDTLQHLQVTCTEALLGFSIAAIAGLIIGGIAAYSRLFERTVYSYLVGIQSMPKVALAPLFVAWFGFGLTSKVGVAALIAFFPVLVNVVVGLKSCDAGKLDVMRALSASEWQIFRLVRLPNALPFVFAGLNVAIVFALTGAIVAEFVGARAGLGYEMMMANAALDTPLTFGILVVLGAIGYLFHTAIDWVGRRTLFWVPAAEHSAGHDRALT
jgi:NitT/TauT family transport system permease protein